MQLSFNPILAAGYHSPSQKIRVMSENWLRQNIYCPNCGERSLFPCPNNTPVSDFQCQKCNNFFELKSTSNFIGNKIMDGAYATMIEKIKLGTMPHLFYLNYDKSTYQVHNLLVIPKHYFVPEIIEKRHPLGPTARRSGWVGCNINLSAIPKSGKLFLIKNNVHSPIKTILYMFKHMLFLQEHNKEKKSWLLDIIKCIETLNKQCFSLTELYAFELDLAKKHPENNHIKPKIRQQLQILRDNKYLKFIKKGTYQLL